MAPVSMQAPVCLIDNGTDGRMSVQQGALQILEQIQEPVVVVAVVGLYRTGKSYLMNRLAGKQKGFALGSTIESKTKGIWMWCVPHPSKPGNTIVLLDTEGLGDVDKGDPKNDTQLFSLAVLLSSSLIYNSRGTIDNRAVEELQYVTELAEFIKVKSCDEDGDDSEFVKFFPSFIWAVRDFTLERKIEGKEATEDEYLDFALKLKAGHSKKVNDYNLPRECIRNYFPSRKCFTFPFPTSSPENVIRMESLGPSELAPAFLEVADRFCSFVFDQSPVKQLKDGHTVDGRILGHMVKMYVEIFSRGDVPCLENAVLAMAQLENEAAVKEGLEVYESGMEQLKANFPVDLKDITSGHQRLTSLATEIFMKRSFKDDDGKHMKSLEEAVDKLFSRFLLQNEDASVLICQEILAGLSAPLKNKLQQGFYTKVGGYQLFCQDMEEIVVKYNSQSHRGEKAEDVLQEFMKQRREESAAILQADQSLSVKDREICAEREKAVLLEQEMRSGQEAQRQLEERMEAQRQSSEERMRQMMDKMQQELKQQQEEERQARESMLREQALLLEKGFKEKADVMTREIEESRRKAEAAQEAKSQEFTRLIEQQDRRHDDVMSLMKQQQEAMMEQQEAMMKKVIPISCCIL